jgi:Uri superfamily endonuclease
MATSTAPQRNQRGTYILVMHNNSREATVQVGRLSDLSLKTGWYLYVGSAFGPGGLMARIERHLRKKKRRHWHIDYLLAKISVQRVWYIVADRKLEHRWAAALLSQSGATIAMPGFGASDCSCKSHLLYFRNHTDVDAACRKLLPQIWLPNDV